ncbi:hypothetical protein FH972_026001 [Carpinus fangiana]|uniref:Uncharacterized protein n=1 Tax=Carpinus fangiana TaxID=176857 RepID=A0A5N6L2W8_9ROSI|nr:hypothetical protein FH972_026001 [Carpinus fangiana]
MSAKPLLWSQRIALVRHNLHISHRSRDFSFFRVLQVELLLANTDHVSLLADAINASADDDSAYEAVNLNRRASHALDADTVISSLDKLAAVIANVYEDAFRTLADYIRDGYPAQASHCSSSGTAAVLENPMHETMRSAFRVEALRQRALAEAGMDKLLDSAVVLITQLPYNAQNEATAVLILGLTFTADAIALTLSQMDSLEYATNDPLRIDVATETVACVMALSISAMKGVFGLMNSSGDSDHQPALKQETEAFDPSARQNRRQSLNPIEVGGMARGWVRRLSAALTSTSLPSPDVSNSTSTAQSRQSSLASTASQSSQPTHDSHQVQPTGLPEGVHNIRMSSGIAHRLSPVPPSPTAFADSMVNPFETFEGNKGRADEQKDDPTCKSERNDFSLFARTRPDRANVESTFEHGVIMS